jgi:hypothetical protein
MIVTELSIFNHRYSMILLIPYTRFTLKTYLKADEAEQRLAAHVEPRKLSRGFSRNHKFFAGKIENRQFNINRIIHYRNSFLPVIVGQIHDDLDTSRIEVTMRISYFVIVFMAVFFFMFSGFLFSESGIDFGGAFPFLGFMIFFYIIAVGFFNFEVNKARRHLEEIFQVHV